MPDKPNDFRDRLLNAQQMTPALREEYRNELDALLNHKLTSRSRALVWGGIIVAIAIAALLVRGLILHHEKSGVKLIFPAYLAVAAGTVL